MSKTLLSFTRIDSNSQTTPIMTPTTRTVKTPLESIFASLRTIVISITFRARLVRVMFLTVLPICCSDRVQGSAGQCKNPLSVTRMDSDGLSWPIMTLPTRLALRPSESILVSLEAIRHCDQVNTLHDSTYTARAVPKCL